MAQQPKALSQHNHDHNHDHDHDAEDDYDQDQDVAKRTTHATSNPLRVNSGQRNVSELFDGVVEQAAPKATDCSVAAVAHLSNLRVRGQSY